MSESIAVKTSTKQDYRIYFGENLDAELSSFVQKYSSEKAFLVVDEFVLNHHQSKFENVLSKKFPQLHTFEVGRGESSKSLEIYTQLLDFLLNTGLDRNTPLIAIGGGVTGDLAGFAAATTLRGIPLIHIPTTLLAMVDSSIGGKTGINHQTGKNLIGSFYQPDVVFADVRYLETLAQKEWVSGLSEVLKYGMIQSPEILRDVQTLIEKDLFTDGKHWLPVIKKSAQIKVDIVAQDVLEAGKRAFLNFGHTFAHVIERKGDYKNYSHGEAVFAGMCGAVHASNKLSADIDISALLDFKHLYDFSLEELKSDKRELVELMKRDKKALNDQIKLVLLKEIGNPYVYTAEDRQIALDAWEFILNTFE